MLRSETGGHLLDLFCLQGCDQSINGKCDIIGPFAITGTGFIVGELVVKK